MHTIADIKAHFAAGAETVTLTKAEWDAVCDVVRAYCATGKERSAAVREAERVKRVARPVWRACAQVSERMRRALSRAPLAVRADLVADWEMRLRHAMTVDWQDLPPGHPGRWSRAR
ncbi:hypothetical protein [Dokdonella sp.]|uniref:hypothetical protein n=1 Tax=Dokdonella sp. TaxID=2291710 RepID=UPI002F42F48B